MANSMHHYSFTGPRVKEFRKLLSQPIKLVTRPSVQKDCSADNSSQALFQQDELLNVDYL